MLFAGFLAVTARSLLFAGFLAVKSNPLGLVHVNATQMRSDVSVH